MMISRLQRHIASSSRTLHLWVFEEAPEILARHMLQLSVLLDSSLPVRQRTENFIELHSNALLQQTTAEYLGRASYCVPVACLVLPHKQVHLHATPAKQALPAEKMGKKLEAITLQYSAKDVNAADDALAGLFDLSLLRFQLRDDLAEIFRKYSQKVTLCSLCIHRHGWCAST